MKPQPIKKLDVLSTDNGGLALHSDVQAWFNQVTDALNYLMSESTDARRLGRLIRDFSVHNPHPAAPWENPTCDSCGEPAQWTKNTFLFCENHKPIGSDLL